MKKEAFKPIIILLIITALLVIGLAAWFNYAYNANNESLRTDEATSAEEMDGPVAPQAEDRDVTNDNIEANPMNPTARIITNMGVIELELYEQLMPITVTNFVTLAESGFYDGTKFHRVIPNFMIQGGDPNTKGDNEATYGQGGPESTIQDEFVADEKLTNQRGTIAMANTGQPNSGGSQWFINLIDNTFLDFDKQPLTSKHPVFGRVTSGLDVVDAIGSVETKARDIPAEPVEIERIEIVRP